MGIYSIYVILVCRGKNSSHAPSQSLQVHWLCTFGGEFRKRIYKKFEKRTNEKMCPILTAEIAPDHRAIIGRKINKRRREIED